MKLRHPAFWWAVVSAMLVIVGSLGTWAKVDAGILSTSVSGTDQGGDGTVLIAVAAMALVGLGLWAAAARRNRWGWLLGVAVLAALMLPLIGYDINQAESGDFLREEFRKQFSDQVTAGWGLYLCALAAVSLLAASVVLWLTTWRRQGFPASPTATDAAGHAPGAFPSQGPPPGWYADPSGSGTQRWWDGTEWSQHRQPAAPGPGQSA